MRAELYNPFIITASEVLAQEVGVQTTRGTLSLQRDAYVTDGVTVLISLVGDVGGSVFYGMRLDTAKAMLSRILGQGINDFNELAQSGVAELGNVITGQACTRLAELGLEIDVSVPALIVGEGSRISTIDIDRLVIPLETELGILRLDLALRVSPSAGKQHVNRAPQVVAPTPSE